MGITAALHHLRPGAQWSIPAGCTTADCVIWHDDTEPVTQAELDAAMALPDLALIAAQRATAYAAEADPIFFAAQRGEATMDEWKTKIAEIRKRYPKPSPSPD
jgi:GAF domain-containing protein